MAFTRSDWDEDYARASRALTQLRSSPSNQRSAQNLQNISMAYDRLTIRLSQMEKAPFDFDLSPSEVARKTVLIENFKKHLDALQSQMNGEGGSNLNNGSYDMGMLNDSHNDSNMDASRDALQQTQSQVMAAQDDMLSELGQGVSRLLDQSNLINEESKFHVRLLDDMDLDVEKASAGLRAETRHAEKIRQESSVCKLYIIIAALSALLCFLLVMGMSK